MRARTTEGRERAKTANPSPILPAPTESAMPQSTERRPEVEALLRGSHSRITGTSRYKVCLDRIGQSEERVGSGDGHRL